MYGMDVDLGTPVPLPHRAPKDDLGCPKGTIRTAFLIGMTVASDIVVSASRKMKSIFKK